MIEIDIKPLSVNKAWKGKRYKTSAYKAYEKELTLKLRMEHKRMFEHKDIHLLLTFFFSTKAADIDNPIKMTQDILSKKYNFNDNCVMDLTVCKRRCEKGRERLLIHATESSYSWDNDSYK